MFKIGHVRYRGHWNLQTAFLELCGAEVWKSKTTGGFNGRLKAPSTICWLNLLGGLTDNSVGSSRHGFALSAEHAVYAVSDVFIGGISTT